MDASWIRIAEPFEKRLLIRSVSLWFSIRLLVTVAALWAGDGNGVSLAPQAAALVIIVVTAVSWIRTRSHNEDLMLANLGTAPAVLAVLTAGPPLILEFAIGLLL